MKKALENMNFRQRGYLGLLGGFLVNCVFGSVYLWGNICEYVTSYLVNQHGQQVTTRTLGLIFPVTLMAGPIGLLLGITIIKKIGQRATLLTFSIFLSFSVFLSSFATHVYTFCVSYGIMFGFSIGVMYMIPLQNAQQYFPANKGTAYGAIIAGYGIGTFIFNWILYFLINPSNIKPVPSHLNEVLYPSEVSENLPFSLRILSLIYLVFTIIGSLLIMKPSERDLLEVRAGLLSLQSLQHFSKKSTKEAVVQPEQKPSEQSQIMGPEKKKEDVTNREEIRETIVTWQESPATAKEEKRREKESMKFSEECADLKMALKQRELYLLAIIGCTGVCFGIVVASNYKNYGQTYHYSDEFYCLVGSLASLCNAFSRFFWGWLLDRMKLKRLLTINLTLQLLLVLCFQFMASHYLFFLLTVVLSFFCYGGWYSVMPAHIYKLFGARFGQQVYTVIAFSFPMAGFIQQFLVRSFDWENVFLIVFGIISLGLIITNVFPLSINWKKKLLLKNIALQQSQIPIQETNNSQLARKQQAQSASPEKKVAKGNYYMMNYEL